MGALTNYVVDGRSLVTDVFIETGLNHGDTLRLACQQPFKSLHSIDITMDYIRKASAEFLKEYRRVFLHHGSSPSVLERIILPSRSTAFWLDAHYSGESVSDFDPEYGQCPLLAELDVILSYSWITPPIIIIDDAHMFIGSWSDREQAVFDPAQWPSIAQISKKLSDYEMIHEGDILHFFAR